MPGISQQSQNVDEDDWVGTAQELWSKGKTPQKITSELIEKRLWEPLQSKGFEFRTLALLENLQLLDYLWDGYDDASTDHHVLLIALMVTVRSRQDLPAWAIFDNDATRFSSLFHRLLSLSLDQTLPPQVQNLLLAFLIIAFQSLDVSIVRKECAPLFSISIWHNLASDTVRHNKIEENAQLKKSWRAATRRYEAADEQQKGKLKFERAWLFALLLNFLQKLYTPGRGEALFPKHPETRLIGP